MKDIKYILLICYILLVLVTTFFLFTFNQFSNSQIQNVTIIGLSYDVGDFSKGDLLLATKKIDKVKKNNDIIYYDTENGKNKIAHIQVEKVMKTNDKEYTYVIKDGLFLSSEYLIGQVDEIVAIPFLGYLYYLLTSKIGYFVFVMIPIMIAFIIFIKKYKGVLHGEKNKN